MSKKGAGFTLIELIVVVGIIVLLSGMSVAALTSFTEKRRAFNDAKLVVEELRRIKTKAVAVEVPPGCSGVIDYTIRISGSAMNTDVNCAVGSVADYLSTSLTDSVFSSDSDDEVSLDISGKVSTVVTLGICANDFRYDVGLSTEGVVSGPIESGGTCL